ncbi:histidine--tRNA ligase [Candidatus Thorarchaeota archaeon]|nr:MAG: histidine--tRNA ligase [Candidatus Thorarchaeota archaeon]
MSELQTVRGMRDLLGPEMEIRNYLKSIAVDVFTCYGYEPLDSPAMELWETLSAKGGEEVEAETFKFTDKGDREVGLRFDLTVPLARIVASNLHLPKPFKRYAIGKAWRYDRPQAGRYREFLQADADIIGSDSPAADAEVVLLALEFARRTFGKDYIVKVNNRKVLRGLIEVAGVSENLANGCFRAMDKLEKIGKNGVQDELQKRGISESATEFLLGVVGVKGKNKAIFSEFRQILKGSKIGLEGTAELEFMADIFDSCEVNEYIEFDISLARGLDYYTGPVFEGKYLGEPDVGSILAGGRYDNLVEKFGGPSTPATGISLGLDRIVDILLEQDYASKLETDLDVFFAPINRDMVKHGMRLRNILVEMDFKCDIDLMDRPLGTLLELADSKNASYTIIVGERDLKKGVVSLRNMKTKETETVNLKEFRNALPELLER